MTFINDSIKTKWPVAFSQEENQLYFEKYRNGDISARNALIEHNVRFVCFVVRSFSNIRCDVEDLISYGIIGLIKAVDSFNPERKIQFPTYAKRCIQNEILSYIRKSNSKGCTVISLNEITNPDSEDEEIILLETLYDDDDEYKIIEKQETGSEIQEALSTLSDLEKTVVEKRYGFVNDLMTQEAIAASVNLGQPYISRVDKRARAKIKVFIEEKERY